ncbi:H/ACA ribonucleoprotein complex non-core subunit NAF1-like isoform X2 [Ptychodera flava]|uniref:H/ACA ribonucleoprotein complex non-core subunit NAF1-like isoform X2 n=1 Tax=Ptychodera flava TaxID=63121 RepID=UPI003969BD22
MSGITLVSYSSDEEVECDGEDDAKQVNMNEHICKIIDTSSTSSQSQEIIFERLHHESNDCITSLTATPDTKVEESNDCITSPNATQNIKVEESNDFITSLTATHNVSVDNVNNVPDNDTEMCATDVQSALPETENISASPDVNKEDDTCTENPQCAILGLTQSPSQQDEIIEWTETQSTSHPVSEDQNVIQQETVEKNAVVESTESVVSDHQKPATNDAVTTISTINVISGQETSISISPLRSPLKSEQDPSSSHDQLSKSDINPVDVIISEANKNQPMSDTAMDGASDDDDDDSDSDSSCSEESDDDDDSSSCSDESDDDDEDDDDDSDDHDDDDEGRESDEAVDCTARKSCHPPPPLRTASEHLMEDLPKIEEVDVKLPDEIQLSEVGSVTSIIGQLVVIQAKTDNPALDLETTLFTENRECFGKIFEVFGPVLSPLYAVRFNSTNHIKSKGIELQDKIYYARDNEEYTSYVFLAQLQRMKGSDASWKNDEEPPQEFLDYSDDEREKEAKAKSRQSKDKRKRKTQALRDMEKGQHNRNEGNTNIVEHEQSSQYFQHQNIGMFRGRGLWRHPRPPGPRFQVQSQGYPRPSFGTDVWAANPFNNPDWNHSNNQGFYQANPISLRQPPPQRFPHGLLPNPPHPFINPLPTGLPLPPPLPPPPPPHLQAYTCPPFQNPPGFQGQHNMPPF